MADYFHISSDLIETRYVFMILVRIVVNEGT